MALDWTDTATTHEAKRALGADHFDYAVARGAGFCEGRKAGQWTANNPELFAAYGAAARAAQS